MPTFAKEVQVLKVVDARQFKGTIKSARELVAWITANGGEAVWQYAQEVRHNGQEVEHKVLQNYLSVYVDIIELGKPVQELQYAKPTCWVVRDMDGDFSIMTDEQMHAEYTQQ